MNWYSNPMSRVLKGIQNCIQGLSSWHKFSNTSINIDLKNKQAKLARKQVNGINQVELAEMKQLEKEVAKLMEQEDMFWRQRSRVNWMLKGDRNTRFFRQKASQRKRKNYVQGITYLNGNWKTNEDSIQDIVVDFVSTLFSSSSHS